MGHRGAEAPRPPPHAAGRRHRVPGPALLGPLDEGWRVATTTLSHERAGVAILNIAIRRRVRELLHLATTTPRDDATAADDPVVRQRLARVYLEAEYLKLLSDRA